MPTIRAENTHWIDVVYENGMLKPLVDLSLEEHKRYRVSLEDDATQTPIELSVANGETDALRLREYAWLHEHGFKYAGQYVAVYGDRLIAHGSDGRTVFQQARAAGFPKALMIRVEASDELPFGGW